MGGLAHGRISDKCVRAMLKLAQEADVVGCEVADVGDAVLQHRDALDAECNAP
jgi:hypothetical protein